MANPAAQAEGQLIGVLFQVRDEYVIAHELVFGGPITRLLRFVGFRKRPTLSSVAASLDEQLRALDAALPGVASLTLSSVRHKHAEEYFQSLRGAICALRTLLRDALARDRLPPSSSAAVQEYRIAAAEFGRVGDHVRQNQIERRPASVASPGRLSGLVPPTGPPARSLRPPPASESAGMRYFKTPIETTTQLGQALFEVASIMSPEAAGRLLQVAGVGEEEIDSLQMEALYLSLFTVRLVFSLATNEGARAETEVLAEFDGNVALYFAPEPECAILYEARSKAYRLVLGPDTVIAAALGREYSRLCRWEGTVAEALGASLVDTLIKATKEAIGAHRNANTRPVSS